MDTNYYRVISIETLNRVPFDGLKGNMNTQRASLDAQFILVERAEGFSINDRWMSHSEAMQLIQTPEWKGEYFD